MIKEGSEPPALAGDSGAHSPATSPLWELTANALMHVSYKPEGCS